VVEIIQIKAKGIVFYFIDIWNLCDVLKTVIMWIYIDLKVEDREEIYQKITSSLNFLLFFKLFLALKQVKTIGILFKLVAAVIKDMIPFASFLLMVLVMNGSTMYFLNRFDYEDEDG
jgi:hypothetical protein